MGFRPPTGVLGAELFYWREDSENHSLLTIAGPLSAHAVGAEKLDVTLALFDVHGDFITSWREEVRAESALFVDSRDVIAKVRRACTEGALVVYVHAPSPAAKYAEHYARSYAMADWFSEAGDLVSLHTDQSVIEKSSSIELTEIVFEETASQRTKLVVVNGPEEQPADALRVTIRSALGEERAASYAHAMRPFSVHSIVLGAIAPGLAEFCQGREATLTGTFAARGIFTRPYVFTESDGRSCGYHGGNRYPEMGSIPRLFHRTFPYSEARGPVPTELVVVSGQREMNPAYAVHRPGLTTRVHLFQSHGDCDDDFAVDASLYDTRGERVAHRERWRVAPRRGVATGDIAELLPRGRDAFEGHVALRFAQDDKARYPRRVQALVEYRTPVSVARSMLWSDRWNAADRVREKTTTRAVYRVFMSERRMTTLAITNPGVGEDYDYEAPYVVRLRSARGEELVHAGTLPPHATHVARIDQLFPRRFDDELGTVIVESAFDLASMQLTTDHRSGVVAAEHLMAIPDRKDGRLITVCGA
jgi:hypothetical protein